MPTFIFPFKFEITVFKKALFACGLKAMDFFANGNVVWVLSELVITQCRRRGSGVIAPPKTLDAGARSCRFTSTKTAPGTSHFKGLVGVPEPAWEL